MAIPIVFIHNGNSEYLPLGIVQARISNPGQQIHLLGDSNTAHFKFICNHHKISDYFKSAGEFEKVYKHQSTNGYDYELFCLQRWFVLLDFMEANNIEQCLYLDSDVLFYSNTEKEQAKFSAYDMTVLIKSPHTNFINSKEGLAGFCDFIAGAYTGPISETLLNAYLTEHYMEHGEVGGISDMTFFLHYRRAHPEKVADISQVIDDCTYDITLDTPNGFEMRGQYKFVTWKLGVPYIREIASGKLIRFATLHFQGENKKVIREYLSNWTTKDYKRLKYFDSMLFRQRVWRKILRSLGLKK